MLDVSKGQLYHSIAIPPNLGSYGIVELDAVDLMGGLDGSQLQR